MKICMLTTCFPRSKEDWSGHFVYQLARSLALQHTVHIVAPGSYHTPSQKSIDGINVHYFTYMIPRTLQRLAYGNGIISNLKKSIVAWFCLPFFLICFAITARKVSKTCDIIHANWIFSGLTALICRRKGKKIVLTVRGSDINILNKSKLLKRINLFVLNRMDHIVTVSDSLRKIVLSFGIAPEKVTTIPNGIDTDLFYPGQKSKARSILNLPEKDLLIIYIGRLIKIKGIDILLEALKSVIKQINAINAYLIGSGELLPRLQETAKKAEIDNKIHFPGSQPPESISDWLNAADIFVLPSLSEGRPNVILEALACGTPILATEVGGIPELIKDGENGCLIPPGKSDVLAEKIVSILNDKKVCEKFSKAGPETIQNFSLTWNSCASKYENLYSWLTGMEETIS